LSPGDPYYDATLGSAVRYPYDPQQAGQSLSDLGFVKGADGILADASGQRLAVEIRTTSGDDVKSKLQLSVADAWKQLGVDASPVEVPRQLTNDLQYRQERPAFELVRQPDDFTANGLKRFQGSEAALPSNNWNGQNRTRYQNADLDNLIHQFTTTIPQQPRAALAGQLV